MKAIRKLFLLLLIFALFMPGSADAIYKGDIDNNRKMELQDAILALQLVSGITPPTPVFKSSAISGNQKIGLAEVIYILQVLSDARIPTDQIPIFSQLVQETNWRIIKTYDQTSVNVKSSLLAERSASLRVNPVSPMSASYTPQSLADIVTYTANGLVTDFLDHIYIDDEYIVVGTLIDGFSYIRTIDVNNPRGKVFNYRGRNTSNAIDRFGLQGFTKRNLDGKIYAWYGPDIVDVINMQIVYSNAPDYTHGIFYCSPKERFLTDNAGNFWIGALNLDEAGMPRGENGLYRISADFSAKEMVLTDAIWNIFKDSSGNLWISSNSGIYRKENSGAPSLVYNSIATDRYAEQILEFNGEIYVIMKNFFHNPNNITTKIFEVYKWDGSTFSKVCDIQSNSNYTEAYGFIYAGAFYVSHNAIYKFNADTSTFSVEHDMSGTIGYHGRFASHGNTLIYPGLGVCLYNFNGDGQIVRLTTANTAEALLADNIHSLYFSQATNRLMIGPEHSAGFNALVSNIFNIYEFPYEHPSAEVNTVGFFEHGEKLYIQGAGNLYYLNGGQVVKVKNFYTNGEKIYFDKRGYLWTFPNWGAGYGGIGVLDLATLNIKGTENYSNTPEPWSLDRSYHFHDIISIPGENAVFIAVGESEINYPIPAMPYVLKYSYPENTFTKVNLPDLNNQGIRVFATDGTVVYGIGKQKLFIYQNGEWHYLCKIKLGGDFRGAKIAGKYLIIISGWNSTGGVEVVDLETKTSVHYDKSQIPIPTNAIFAIEIQNFGNNNFRLWLGTFSGLAYCDLVIEDAVITPIIPPPPPTGLVFESCSSGTANLRWDGSSAPNLAGYKVYYGTQPGMYGTSVSVGNVTNYQVTGLNPNVTWYFAVTSLDSHSPANEGEYSAEVSCMGSGLPTISLTGSVADSNNAALGDVTVDMVGNPLISSTSDGSGNYTIMGLPSGSVFSVKFSKNEYTPVYSINLQSTSNLRSLRPFVLFPISQLAAWNIEPGKAVITTQIVNYANPSQGYISGAVVTASSALGQNYVVQYFDGNAYGGSATYGNGSFYIFNVLSGDTVTVRTQKDGWNFTTRVYVTHADSVSEGTVYGTLSP